MNSEITKTQNLCNHINLLYMHKERLNDSHIKDWIKEALIELKREGKLLATDMKRDIANQITRQNLRHYEIIRNDQLKEDELKCRSSRPN